MRKYLEAAQERELLEVLVDSIKANGQLVPIIMDKKGNIIDGKQRAAAMKCLGMEPKSVVVDKASWKALNVDRRHLSPGQRALIAADLATTEVGDNQHAAGAVTQATAARVCGVSSDTIQRVRAARKLAVELGKDPCAEVDARLTKDEKPNQVFNRLTVEKEARAVRKATRSGTLSAANHLKALRKQGAKFHVIYADPPWCYSMTTATSRVAPHHHYPTMTTNAIARLPIKDVAADQSVLWLWVPNCLLEDGLRVMRAWGYKYVTNVAWIKRHFVVSPGTVLPQHEVLLFGKRGHLAAAGRVASVLDTSDHPLAKHSQKPAEVAATIERLYPTAAKLELFCRQPRPGWTAWGNQAKPKVQKQKK